MYKKKVYDFVRGKIAKMQFYMPIYIFLIWS